MSGLTLTYGLPFSVAGNYLKAEGAKTLAEALHVNTSMTSLKLADNEMFGKKGKSGIQAFADAVGNNTTLTALDISKTGLSPKDAPIIAEALSVNTSLTSINLSSNRLCAKYSDGSGYDPTGIQAIAHALSVSTSMKSLK